MFKTFRIKYLWINISIDNFKNESTVLIKWNPKKIIKIMRKTQAKETLKKLLFGKKTFIYLYTALDSLFS